MFALVVKVLLFIFRSFWTRNSWGQTMEDDQKYGKWSLVVVGSRVLIMFNGLVVPVALITKEQIRIVAVIADMILLPTFAVLSAIISRYMTDEQKAYYTKNELQLRCTQIGVLIYVGNFVFNLLRSDYTRSYMVKPVAIVHDPLYCLGARKLIPYVLAVFDRKIPMPFHLRVITIIVMIATVLTLGSGALEYFIENVTRVLTL